MVNAVGSPLIVVSAIGLTTAIGYASSDLIYWGLQQASSSAGSVAGFIGTRLAGLLIERRGNLTTIFAELVFVVAAHVLWQSAAG